MIYFSILHSIVFMTTYEQDTWGWKLGKLMQRSQEWWELKVRNLFGHSPELPQIDTPNLSVLGIIIQGILLVIATFLIFWGVLRIVHLIRVYYSTQSKVTPQNQLSELLAAQ